MPGLHLASGGTLPLPGVADPALDATRFRDDYVVDRTPLDDALLGSTRYPGYPVTRVETEDAVAVLDGRLYDAPDERAAVRRLAADLVADRRDAVAEWQRARDGDFVVAVHHRGTGRSFVLNDTLARLPVYHATIDGSVVASRELAFVREAARRVGSPLEIDRLGAAQQLLFGYPLGDRTLFAGVRTLPPGSLLRIESGEARVERLTRLALDGAAHGDGSAHGDEAVPADRSVEENAAALAERFVAACRARSREGAVDVVSLSGGLDSRAVAAGYVAADVPITTATYQLGDGGPSEEAELARTVARALGVDWARYEVAASPARRRWLLDAMQGMNYLGMAHILAFFEGLRGDHGPMTYVTGDGGDKALVDLSPPRSLSGVDETVEYLLAEYGRLQPAEAAAVADVAEGDLRGSVAARLDSYPESDWERRYAHFLVRERGLNFLNHGEDRNRYFFWSVSPFYAPRVFRYAMACPDSQKRHERLFAAFLDRLEPAVVDVPYANFGAPITSLEYRLKRLAFDALSRYPAVKRPVVRFLVGDGGDDEVVAAVESQLSRADLRPLAPDAIRAILAESGSHRAAALSSLHTVTSLVEDVNGTPEADADARRVEA